MRAFLLPCRASCTLLMGSTAGKLWGSLDGGEHGQAVSANLPPIHPVRIG